MPKFAYAIVALALLILGAGCLTVFLAISGGPWGYAVEAVLITDLLLFFLPIRAKAKYLLVATTVSFAVFVGDVLYIFLYPASVDLGKSFENGVWVDMSRPNPLGVILWATTAGLIIFAPYGAGLLIWKKIVWRVPSPTAGDSAEQTVSDLREQQ